MGFCKEEQHKVVELIPLIKARKLEEIFVLFIFPSLFPSLFPSHSTAHYLTSFSPFCFLCLRISLSSPARVCDETRLLENLDFNEK